MDETGDVFLHYYVYSYPTTYMIDKEGNVFGYLTGSMPESTMRMPSNPAANRTA